MLPFHLSICINSFLVPIDHGGMSSYSRKISLQKFNHDPLIRVMVMSLKAGGVGLNLQKANHMIILDRWWNPGTLFKSI